ncbi:MAG: peptidylprolyl isomerase [Chitinophagaceae bacterium]|nr:MAG: peptidylprolyl isomerase [Chitinophagaceae bacterium]
MIKNIFAAGTALLVMQTASAQAQAKIKTVSLDKIIGVVNDRIILKSEIDNVIEDAKRNGQAIPPNAKCFLLEQSILKKVLALQAQKDSLLVSDDEVESALDEKTRQMVMQVGSVQLLEEYAGKTIYQMKDEARQDIKDDMLGNKMRNDILKNINVTPSEVSEYFNRVPKDSLPFVESEIEVGQIVILPKAAKEVQDYVYNEMLNYKKQLEGGRVSFADMAKRYSEDPGSKERGGTYEINRNDKTSGWDPVFMQTVFRLKTGEISQPVFSKNFGYFLIKMDERRGDDAKISMILRIPPVSDADLEPAIAKLDSVRNLILEKKISFKDAAYKFSEDDDAIKQNGPFIINIYNRSTLISYDMLDKDAIPVIKDMKTGDISKATIFSQERSQKKGVRLLYLKSRTEAHVLNLNDDYTKISEQALNEKKNKEMDKWLQKTVPNYHVLLNRQFVEDCSDVAKKYTIVDNF